MTLPVDRTVDLRSDTVTRPTEAMRRAMAEAVVGDDVLGDDPTVQELERRVAALAGKERALYVPSGTMGNQIAIHCHIRPGDEILLEQDSHIFFYEQGGAAANSGAFVHIVAGERGVLAPAMLQDFLREEEDHVARVKLVCIENTHNRGGGAIVPLAAMASLAAFARERSLGVHLDGARLWNASVATGIPIRDWAAHADTLMMCFSKGLGAPVGSILVGSAALIHEARRVRKRWGGGMRQVGILAAACLHALDHHVERLAEDHRRAKRLAAGLREAPGVRVDEPDTNIVFVEVEDRSIDVAAVMAGLERQGVRMAQYGPRRIRSITHLDVDDRGVERAIEVFGDVVRARPAATSRF